MKVHLNLMIILLTVVSKICSAQSTTMAVENIGTFLNSQNSYNSGPSYADDDRFQPKIDHIAGYAEFNVSRWFSKAQLQSVLQTFVDQVHGKGFRYFGDKADFDHGHIVFRRDGGTVNPWFILYHTQENASQHVEGTKYGYLNKNGRNWIQWIQDSSKVQNAMNYKISKPSIWNYFTRSRYNDQFGELDDHYTINTEMISWEKIGKLPLMIKKELKTDGILFKKGTYYFVASEALRFKRVSCDSVSEQLSNPDSEIIQIKVGSMGIQCAQLYELGVDKHFVYDRNSDG